MLAFAPEAVHIATEGPLGQAARALCLKWKMPFTTSYHTKFPEYIKARFPFVPLSWPYKFVRDFHNSGGQTMVTTPSMVEFLQTRGFTGLAPWARGVDLSIFHTGQRFNPDDVYKNLPRPIFVNIGRIAVEKNKDRYIRSGDNRSYGDGHTCRRLSRHRTPEYEPNARRRWRRTRRLIRIASSPYHIFKRNMRRLWRVMRGKGK